MKGQRGYVDGYTEASRSVLRPTLFIQAPFNWSRAAALCPDVPRGTQARTAVNRLVAGSNPARGAKQFQALSKNTAGHCEVSTFVRGTFWGTRVWLHRRAMIATTRRHS
jgi:hypothetical protein